MSFSQGFGVGFSASTRLQDRLQKRHLEELHNKLFAAAVGLKGEGDQLDAEGAQIINAGKLFAQASPDDMAGYILRNYRANGGKINGETVQLAYTVASELGKMRNVLGKYAARRALFSRKVGALKHAAERTAAFARGAQQTGAPAGSQYGPPSLADALAMRRNERSLKLFGRPFSRLKSYQMKRVEADVRRAQSQTGNATTPDTQPTKQDNRP